VQGYSKIFLVRSLGTFGFVVACLISLVSVDKLGFKWLYAGYGAAYALAMIAVFNLAKGYTSDHQPPRKNVLKAVSDQWNSLRLAVKQLRHSLLAKLLVPVALMSCANSMAFNIQGNYVPYKYAGADSTISLSWLIGSGFEIPIMFLCVYLLKRWNLTVVLSAGIIGTLIRIAGMDFSPTLGSLLFFLTLHGMYYAGVVTGLTIAIDRTETNHKPSLQLLCSLVYSGIPHALGCLMAGFLWDLFSLQFVYHAATAIALVSVLLFLPVIPSLKRTYY
jgi:hypothetical protein